VRRRPPASGRRLPDPLPEFLAGYRAQAEGSIAEPFVGVTASGTPESGLFYLRDTGVSTERLRDAASQFLASLDARQRAGAVFPVDSDAWRRWSNIHVFVMRHGLSLEGMSEAQRDRALRLMQSALSDHGFETARDIMRLNETIREITGLDDEYGEWPYWVSVLGEPSATEPWGWQIDGHHLILNCFVLGSQLVTTPMFMGSEPVLATKGKYNGTRVFAHEEAAGLAFMRSLTPDQQRQATLGTELPPDVFTTGYRDNFELRYEGLRFDGLNATQQDQLISLLAYYVGRTAPEHATVKMAEVREHLNNTYFAWIGAHENDSVFYYRIHSPVTLVEFDHQRGVALDVDQPYRDHIHTVVRTPNGNDYGKDLLRQHHERFKHSQGGHSPR
jgi:hypothetical protein